MSTPAVRPFTAWLTEQREGALLAELSEALQTLVHGCADLQKPGSLTLVVKVKPSDDGATLFVADDVKLVEAKADRHAALYFADEHGNLTRRDPRQMDFDSLREVPPQRTAEEA